ncbi:MAG: type II CAAX endopeptidase family protein [Kovacikia sp.]
MTLKRLFLIVLTALVATFIGLGLWQSFSQPQFQSRLELYQTNLVLQASEWQPSDANLAASSKALLGGEPLKAGTEAYQTFRDSVQKNLKRTQASGKSSSTASVTLETSTLKLKQLLVEVDVRLGILQAAQGKGSQAQTIWTSAIQQADAQTKLEPLSKTAGVLTGLWSDPPQLFPDAESRLKKNLDGWFRYRGLAQLYKLQQKQNALAELQVEEQRIAKQSFQRLAIVGGIPVLGCLIGVGLLLFLGGQWLLQRKRSLLAPEGIPPWSVPWDGEIVWQVLVVGFFLVGQILFPFILDIVRTVFGFNPAGLGERARAVYILFNYILLAVGGLTVLYLSIQKFVPLPEGWFRFSLRGNWFWWGLGGYLAALPLVILVSLINQAVWQGQGGSNPILPIALEGKDNGALAIFFLTASVAAPLFEETLFRGFLLPSLTRYLPIWGAITLSALIFAIAHLSLSEVLPLTILGIVLGFVYARSRNLLASMLLHSLWNSGTLVSLILLGSAK